MSPDSTVLYVTGFDSSDPTRYLLALDLRSLRVLWRRDLGEIAASGTIGGLTLTGNSALVASCDGTRLILDGARNGMFGLASISLTTMQPLTFYGPFVTSDGAGPVACADGAADVAVAVVGTREATQRPTAGMLLLLGSDLLPVDSAILVPASDDRLGAMRQVTIAPNGTVAFVSTADSVLAYALRTSRVEARAPRLSSGSLTVDPAGDRVYLTDPGDGRDTPGTGLLFVYDQDLHALAPLDLRTASVNGVPPVTNHAVPGPEPRLLYVTSGTASRGPLYGPQQISVLIVDGGSGVVPLVITLNDWGAARVFPTRE